MPNVQTHAKRKTWAVIVACLLGLCLMTFMNFGGRQAQAVNLSRACTITASFGANDPDAPKNLNADLSLYRVASATEQPGYDAFTFSVEPAFDTTSIKSQIDALNDTSKGTVTAESLSDLAQEAAQIVASQSGPVPVAKAALGQPASVQAGLYLMVVTDANVQGNGLESVKGKWVSYAYSENKRYAFEPQLATVPTKGPGISNTADPAEWVYDLDATLKYTETPRVGSLEIIKDLPEIAEVNGIISGTTFVFSIEGTRDGQSVYSNVVAITFDVAGSNSVIVDNIPVDLDVTVTELYSGAIYKPVGDTVKHVQILPTDGSDGNAEHATVTFTNSYDRTNNRGGSVVNSFANSEGGWTWNHDEEVA